MNFLARAPAALGAAPCLSGVTPRQKPQHRQAGGSLSWGGQQAPHPSQLLPAAEISPLPTSPARAAQAHPAPSELQLGWSPGTQMSPPRCRGAPHHAAICCHRGQGIPGVAPLIRLCCPGHGVSGLPNPPSHGIQRPFSPTAGRWEFGSSIPAWVKLDLFGSSIPSLPSSLPPTPQHWWYRDGLKHPSLCPQLRCPKELTGSL